MFVYVCINIALMFANDWTALKKKKLNLFLIEDITGKRVVMQVFFWH